MLRVLLRAAWDQPEPERLLVLADCLEESGEALAAEYVRLRCLAGSRATFSNEEYRRLRSLDRTLLAVPRGPWGRGDIELYPCP